MANQQYKEMGHPGLLLQGTVCADSKHQSVHTHKMESPLHPGQDAQLSILRLRPPQEGIAVGLVFFPLCLKSRSGFWVFIFLTFLEEGSFLRFF